MFLDLDLPRERKYVYDINHLSNEERKKYIQKLIKSSDYPRLTEYVAQLEGIQENIIKFDDPSLVLLAVELYLDPTHLSNPRYQFEIIIFLLKCGLSLFVPKGTVVIYLLNKAQEWGITDEKLYDLFKSFIDAGFTNFLVQDLPDLYGYYGSYYESCYDYIYKNQAAIKIQRFWRRKRKNKQEDEILFTYERNTNL